MWKKLRSVDTCSAQYTSTFPGTVVAWGGKCNFRESKKRHISLSFGGFGAFLAKDWWSLWQSCIDMTKVTTEKKSLFYVYMLSYDSLFHFTVNWHPVPIMCQFS